MEYCTTKKGERIRKKQQKQIEYANEKKTTISMQNGLRTLNFASSNPDSMRDKETQPEITKCLTGNKIRLSAIQETHIARDCNYMVGNYRVIAAAAEKAIPLE